MGLTNEPAPWNPAKRVSFRFIFTYLVLYSLPFPLQFIPGLLPFNEELSLPQKFVQEKVLQPYEDFWNWLVPWVGSHVLDVTITVRPNGSGDTTYNYVQVFCFAWLAVLATTLWTLLDWRSTNYRRLYGCLRVYIRFALAAWMVTYGAVKVIQSQFPGPSLDRLLQPFGDASPMGLLWTFMGASASYNFFTGASEMLGGLLLTTRRTTLLGALVCIGVVGNVAMLNFSYDVPVKLFSLHLLAMAVFLAVPDIGRLADVFVFNRPVPAADCRSVFQTSWLNYGLIAVRTAVVAAFIGVSLLGAAKSREKFGDAAPKSPLYGIWSVEELEMDGKGRPPLLTDESRWRRVVFDYPQMMAIQLVNNSRQRYMAKIDAQKHTLDLSKRDDPAWKSSLTYEQPQSEVLVLRGTFDGHPLLSRLRLVPPSEFLLLTRGFHWINEYPFNR
jgi:hypothetical protein